MLPSVQVRQGLVVAHRHALTSNILRASATALVRGSLAHNHSQPRRSFWGWRRGTDWSSHLDPLYHRFCRIRTLKTRAKLLRKLQRRGKFEWDGANAADFFTPKHVRFATRWDGPAGRRPWWSDYLHDEDGSKKKDDEGRRDEDGGYELSKREKEWKEQMEAMRKRIESDPYEAMFGKRFEPFWSVLVPSYMREEMGLPVWKEKMATARNEPVKSEEPKPEVKKKQTLSLDEMQWPNVDRLGISKEGKEAWARIMRNMKEEERLRKEKLEEKAKTKATESMNASTTPTAVMKDKMEQPPLAAGKTSPEAAKPETFKSVAPAEQKSIPSSYSYASSTSWDSWSNKTRRVEWDSVSGQTKRYEYDPISHRMKLVEPPKPEEPKAVDSAPEQSKDLKPAAEPVKSKIETKADEKAANIPIKQSNDVRQSIPIPPPLSQPFHSIPIGFTATPTSIGPLKSTAVATEVVKNTALTSDHPKKPAAVAKVAEAPKQEDAKKSPSTSYDTLKANLAAKLAEGERASASDVKPPKTPLEALTADDVRANMGKTRSPITNTDSSSMPLKFAQERLQASINLPLRPRLEHLITGKPTSEWDKAELSVLYDRELENLNKKKEKLLKDERGLFHIEKQKRELIKLDQRIKELVQRVEKLNEEHAGDATSQGVRALDSVDMQNLKAPTGLQSTLDRMQSDAASKKRVTASAAVEESVTDVDDAAAHESTEPLEPSASSNVPKDWSKQADLLQADRVRRTRDIKQKPLLTIEEVNARKAAHAAQRAADEAKAAEEIAKIKAEQQRLEREKKLEAANAMLEAEVKEQKFRMQAHENRYAHKIRSLRHELETAYKQSAVHGEKHVERIRFLEAELAKATGFSGEKADVAPKNWYKETMSRLQTAPGGMKLEQQKRDRELVNEIKDIYEKQYGVIDEQHRQKASEDVKFWSPTNMRTVLGARKTEPKVVEVESDVDLGEALAKYEKETEPYKTPVENLEKSVQAEEREANEGVKLVDDRMPRLIPTELAKPTPEAITSLSTSPAQASVQWAEPPVYKVLAYDSGNDMMSTATTTSNFSGTETPISIPEALSELYQPARFVPHFAELQGAGYQVIYGTKDLLVFRKVKEASAVVEEEDVGSVKEVKEEGRVGLEDHGLVAGEGHPDHWATFRDKIKQDFAAAKNGLAGVVNPVEGTSKSVTETQYEPVISAAESTAKAPTTASKTKDGAATETHDSKALTESEPFDEDIDWRHYPRVKREEYPVFTGTRRKWRSERREKRRAERERNYKRRTLRRALGVGVGAAGVMYMVGALAEKNRIEQVKGEDWARRAEEERRRYKGSGW